jgi:hypothetical protein
MIISKRLSWLDLKIHEIGHEKHLTVGKVIAQLVRFILTVGKVIASIITD